MREGCRVEVKDEEGLEQFEGELEPRTLVWGSLMGEMGVGKRRGQTWYELIYFQCLFLLMQSTGGRSASGICLVGDESLEGDLLVFFFFFLFGLRSVEAVISHVGEHCRCSFSMVMVRWMSGGICQRESGRSCYHDTTVTHLSFQHTTLCREP